MKILLYNPDNGVTQNFMPHLWMFLLQTLTPRGHEVVLIDGNARPMSDGELVRFVLNERIGLVGIGAMTRMIAKAYRVADALRAAGIPVVMGGPHVTEVPDEALGHGGGARHADAVALGEADQTWPLIVEDAARGRLKEIYAHAAKPDLNDYPPIPWDSLDTPGVAGRTLGRMRGWPPVLPVFGQITPYPATPLYDRLEKEGRLTRPNHWLEFSAFRMAHTPLNISVAEVQDEVRAAWTDSYSPAANERALDALADAPVPYKISHLASRMFFRGIYFNQKGVWRWLKLIARNRRSILRIVRESRTQWHGAREPAALRAFDGGACRQESGSD